jgi:hypothetical protein
MLDGGSRPPPMESKRLASEANPDMFRWPTILLVEVFCMQMLLSGSSAAATICL